MTSSEIATEDNLFSFFYDRVHSARTRQQVPLSDETEFYLVNLLVGFLDAQALFHPGGERKDHIPFAVRLRSAQAAKGDGCLRELKHVGDSTLYLTGFFSPSLKRRLMEPSYYMALGEQAYRSLAVALGGRRGEGEDGLFGELSRTFPACVEVLGEVSEGARGSTNQDILALYEAWLAEGSERTRRRLTELGVFPGGGGPGRDTVH